MLSLFSFDSIHDFAEDAPFNNNGVKHGEDGAGDEIVEATKVMQNRDGKKAKDGRDDIRSAMRNLDVFLRV